jgi:hypothetical protein
MPKLPALLRVLPIATGPRPVSGQSRVMGLMAQLEAPSADVAQLEEQRRLSSTTASPSEGLGRSGSRCPAMALVF